MNQTPRQLLVSHAVTNMRVYKTTAHMALESVVDGCTKPGTYGYIMRQYYLSVSERGLTRLINEVQRKGA